LSEWNAKRRKWWLIYGIIPVSLQRPELWKIAFNIAGPMARNDDQVTSHMKVKCSSAETYGFTPPTCHYFRLPVQFPVPLTELAQMKLNHER
jgi:hypothetical protein